DIGTVVLPQAGLKIYITARPEIRAKRRARDLNLGDDPKTLARLTDELAKRDQRDSGRRDSPLRPASDAILLDTSDLTLADQVNVIIRLAADKFSLNIYGAVNQSCIQTNTNVASNVSFDATLPAVKRDV
ncbi:MAG: (d)CMP kinase, partial [Calditrichota bacterium]